ncbi:MAG TPA: coenzyme A pyrophosphatase, partial [Flavobacterium sp.]|nr:coenzyme A pyrophosphatase [Flavobacterium sp.]
MLFIDFIKHIPKIEKEKLLSTMAHIKMAPFERVASLDKFNIDYKNSKKAAVLILLYPKLGITHMALIERNAYAGVHSSQISFPGGKVEESDFDLLQTALRETFEEVGVPSRKIKIIKPFSEIYIPPSNFLVYPFLGFCSEELQFVPNAKEVKQVLEFPIAAFLDDSNVKQIFINTSYATNTQVPAFVIDK